MALLIIGHKSSGGLPNVLLIARQKLATSGSMNEEADYKGNSGSIRHVTRKNDATIPAVVNGHSSPFPAPGTLPSAPVSGDGIIDAKSEEANNTNAISDNVVHSGIANDAAVPAMSSDRVGRASAAVPSSNASVNDGCAPEDLEESSELIDEDFGESLRSFLTFANAAQARPIERPYRTSRGKGLALITRVSE